MSPFVWSPSEGDIFSTNAANSGAIYFLLLFIFMKYIHMKAFGMSLIPLREKLKEMGFFWKKVGYFNVKSL